MHPVKSIVLDRCPYSDLIQTVAVTVVEGDPYVNPQPGDTYVFQPRLDAHQRMLSSWFRWAEVVVGHNLLFDLAYLSILPAFRSLYLKPLVDTRILAFLWSDQLPSASLKELGPLFHVYSYEHEATAREGQTFRSDSDPALHTYNASDSHRTVLLLGALLQSIRTKHGPDSPKLDARCFRYWSDTIWMALSMTLAGVPLDLHGLHQLRIRLESELQSQHAQLHSMGLQLTGPGSGKSKAAFLDRCLRAISEAGTCRTTLNCPTVHDYPGFVHTETGDISTCATNRILLASLLPPDSDLLPALRLWDQISNSEKLLSTYAYPLTLGSRRIRADGTRVRSSIAIPLPDLPGFHHASGATSGLRHSADHSIGIAFPTFYLVPGSFAKSGTDHSDDGGQVQGRISVKHPSVQTFPPQIKAYLRGSSPERVLVSFDLSQIELRVAGVLSGEPTIVDEYRLPNPDLHTKRAVFVFGPEVLQSPDFKSGDMTRDPRQWGKQFNFTDLYRAGPYRLQITILRISRRLMPIQFFRQVVSDRPRLRPVLWDWQERLIAQVRQSGYFEIPEIGLGRSFWGFDPTDPEQVNMLNEVLNMPIQGCAAATQRHIEIGVLRRLPPPWHRNAPFRMVMDWHDALYFDCLQSAIPDLEALYRDAFQEVATHGFWARLCERTSHWVPLQFDMKVSHPSTASSPASVTPGPPGPTDPASHPKPSQPSGTLACLPAS
jgi:DNA polymerase I-like protein with 3'-5' exonuclease and polymerase domains